MTAPATTAIGKYQDYGRPMCSASLHQRDGHHRPAAADPRGRRAHHPHFADRLTAYNLFRDMFASLLIALPMALVMITGDIDISVGSMVGLSCSLLGLLYASGVPFELAMVIVLVMGAAGGLLNGC